MDGHYAFQGNWLGMLLCCLFPHKWKYAVPHSQWRSIFCERCGWMEECFECVTHTCHNACEVVYDEYDALYTDHGGESGL